MGELAGGAVLTTEQAVALARLTVEGPADRDVLLAGGRVAHELGGFDSHDGCEPVQRQLDALARYVLAVTPVVAAAVAQERVMSGLGHNDKWLRVYDEATDATESAVRAMRAGGGE